MRELNIGTKRHTKVIVLDDPGPGNANHIYEISFANQDCCLTACRIWFQKGPVKEYGVNGVHNEDLIAIVIDRLRGFESGDYACSENATALKSLENALFELNHRTKQREARGVEGTNTI